jgi:hypothetical protein
MNKPKVSFPSKGAPKPYAHKTPLQTHTHTHQNAQTQLEFVCLQKSTKTLSIGTPSQKQTHKHKHTHTHTKCTNPNKVFLQNVQQSKTEFDNLQI